MVSALLRASLEEIVRVREDAVVPLTTPQIPVWIDQSLYPQNQYTTSGKRRSFGQQSMSSVLQRRWKGL
jgi:hypothetical protein